MGEIIQENVCAEKFWSFFAVNVNGKISHFENEFELTCEEKCDSLYFYESQIQRCLELNCKGK